MRAWKPPVWKVTLRQGDDTQQVEIAAATRYMASWMARQQYPGWKVERVEPK